MEYCISYFASHSIFSDLPPSPSRQDTLFNSPTLHDRSDSIDYFVRHRRTLSFEIVAFSNDDLERRSRSSRDLAGLYERDVERRGSSSRVSSVVGHEMETTRETALVSEAGSEQKEKRRTSLHRWQSYEDVFHRGTWATFSERGKAGTSR